MGGGVGKFLRPLFVTLLVVGAIEVLIVGGLLLPSADSKEATPRTAASLQYLDQVSERSNKHGAQPDYMSKRRTPHGPDPIHNRRAGRKFRRPPGPA